MRSELPSGWREATWGEIAELAYGKALRERLDDGPVTVYGTNGPTGRTDRELGDGPTVIIGRKGAYRGVHYAEGPFWVIDTAFFLVPAAGVDIAWAYYELLTHDINGLDSGSAIPSTRREDFYAMPVRLPPIDEQRRIARLLRALDDKIDSNRRLATVLEAAVAAMFRGLFVDGVADGARPAGGRVGALKDLADTTKESVDPSETPDAIFEHFSIPAFDASSGPEEVPGATILSGKTRIPDGDVVLLSKLNPRMKRVWWPRPSGVGTPVCSPEFLALAPRSGIPTSYLYAVVRFDQRFYAELLSHVRGTTGSRQRVKPQDALECSVVVPSPDELRVWDAFARPLLDLARGTRAENGTLAKIRDALLPKLVSGTMRVPEARDVANAVGVAPEEVAA